MTTSIGTTNLALLAVGSSMWDWLQGEVLFHVAVIGAAAMLLWWGINWAEQWRARRLLYARTPRALFRELCRAHGLSRADRQLLAAVLETVPSHQCCRVFVDRRIIDGFARMHPADADECRYLARVLFGAPASGQP